MTDTPKGTKVKAIRSGIAITTDDNLPSVSAEVVEELKSLLKQAEEGLIQEIAISTCGEVSKLSLMGLSPQMGYQLRGLTLLYEEQAYGRIWDSLYGIE